jgi:hypothetical protein
LRSAGLDEEEERRECHKGNGQNLPLHNASEEEPSLGGPLTAKLLAPFFFARQYAPEWQENQQQNKSFQNFMRWNTY